MVKPAFAYKSLSMLPANTADVGLYAYLSGNESEEVICSSVAVDNIINGEVITARVKDDIRLQGVKMTARDVDFAATNFIFETSSGKYNYEYNFKSIDLEIDLDTGTNSSLAISNRDIELSNTIHHANYIKVSGNLKITLAGDGKFKGVSLGGMVVDIKASNLIIESVQDILSQKLRGANLNIGFNKEYNFTGFGGGIEHGSKEQAWTKQVARIIGSQLVNICVKETLEIAGGLIANAQEDKNGNLSDKDNLSVNCGRMIVKNIHDYDQGVTLAIGANFQVQNSQEQTGKGTKEVSFHHAPVKIQFKDHQQVISSTIGLGQVTYGSISGDQLQRDISQHQQITKKQQAEFDSVVHADMPETIFGPNGKGPEITKIPKDELKKALPKMLGSYFAEIFNNMQQASKDVILKGAKIVNIFGAEINIKQLEKNLERNLDWHFGLKLTATEIQEFEQQLAANYQKELKKLVDEKDQEISKNEQQYLLFFENLKEEIAAATASDSNKGALQAMLHIAEILYKKEQNAASKEGRAIKDFKEFIQQLNQNIYHDPAFADKIHDNLAKTLLKTQLVMNEQLHSEVKHKINKQVSNTARKPEDTSLAEKTNHREKQQQKDNIQDNRGIKEEVDPPSSTKPKTVLLKNDPTDQRLETLLNPAAALSTAAAQNKEQNLSSNQRDSSTVDAANLFNRDGPVPKVQHPGWQPKTPIKAYQNTQQVYQASGKYQGDLAMSAAAGFGEAIDSAGQNFAYVIAHTEGGTETLEALSYPINVGLDKVKGFLNNVLEERISKEQYYNLKQWYQQLPYGAQVTANFVLDGVILTSAASIFTIAGSTAGIALSLAGAGSLIKNVADFAKLGKIAKAESAGTFPAKVKLLAIKNPSELAALGGKIPVTEEIATRLRPIVNYNNFSRQYFDADLKYLEHQMQLGGKITDFDPAIKARMEPLIKVDSKTGKIKGLHDFEGHHIIHQAMERDYKSLFERLGFDIHAPENKIFLPSSEELLKRNLTDRSKHKGKHHGEAVNRIRRGIINVEKEFQANTISIEEARSELSKVITKERVGLESGKYLLNKGRKKQ